jgi:hypothetical protein
MGSIAAGCSDPPSTMPGCATNHGEEDRENCYFRIAQGLVDDQAAMTAAVSTIPDPQSRDLLRLRLAIQDPVRLAWLCEAAEGEEGRKRCRNIVSRPHLRKPPPPESK